MIVFSFILTAVTFLFIVLGALLFIYANQNGVDIPLLDNSPRTDLLFPEIALRSGLGEFLGIVFILIFVTVCVLFLVVFPSVFVTVRIILIFVTVCVQFI